MPIHLTCRQMTHGRNLCGKYVLRSVFCNLTYEVQILEMYSSYHDKGIGCDPHSLTQGEAGMLYEHRYSEGSLVSHLSLEI